MSLEGTRMAIDGKELARRLRAAREGAGVTQDQAASTIGVSRPAVAQIEAGRRSVSGIELSGLAGFHAAANAAPGWLMGFAAYTPGEIQAAAARLSAVIKDLRS